MESKILIFSNNFILAEGVRSIVRRESGDSAITIQEKISFGNDGHTSLVFIDDEVLSDPCVYSLEKIRKYYSRAKIALICKRMPTDEVLPYIEVSILYSDKDEIIHEKIRQLFEKLESTKLEGHTGSILSGRESEVLRHVALGLTNREISDTLSISAHTVITHRKNITAKLGIKTIAGLAVYAVINGIISTEEMNA